MFSNSLLFFSIICNSKGVLFLLVEFSLLASRSLFLRNLVFRLVTIVQFLTLYGTTSPNFLTYFSLLFHYRQRMGNLDGWGGPLPLTWHAKTLALQQKILTRMRSYGMIPVLPGFAGHVPKALVLRVFPDAKYTNSSVWVGFGDQYRTVLLDPLDPLFKVWDWYFFQFFFLSKIFFLFIYFPLLLLTIEGLVDGRRVKTYA